MRFKRGKMRPSDDRGFYTDATGFTLLASGKPRWRSFGAGLGIEFFVLACALWLPMLFPKQMATAKEYMVMHISVPRLDPWKPQPKVQPRRIVPRKPEIEKAAVIPPTPPKPKMIEPVFDRPVVVHNVVRHNPTQAPKVNEFARAVPDVPTMSLGSSAMPNLKKPKAPVQTGGFGDPDGLKPTEKVTRPVNINQAGGFDLPDGPGKGNGKGGAKGVQGAVESAGFGNDTAIAGGTRHGGAVQEGMFADDRATTGGPHVRKTADSVPNETPVVVLFKPNPQYTAEGKQDKVQGDVILQVVFRATGEVEIVRVVQGLGHGLDQNAETAARQIKFKPAEQDGKPVDFPANVRIQFELAY
jgi:TonB family protein